jgi:DMSO/TMAO reductase YedYZ molybdopterin-dependent catalytic subunit
MSSRLPPGQVLTKKWPVLHYSQVPNVDLAQWRFRIWGAVEQPLELTWEEVHRLPRAEVLCDIHCVTAWSRYDNRFAGPAVSPLLALAKPLAVAKHVMVHALPDYTTNLPLADLDRPENLLATEHDGSRLPRARRTHSTARAPSLPLEKREMGHRIRASGTRLAGILGGKRVSHAG